MNQPIDISTLSFEQIEQIDPVFSMDWQGQKIHYHVPNRTAVWRVETLFSKEPDTLEWLGKIAPGEVLADIGANVGMYAIWAAVTRQARVFAFEPESQNYALLNKNIRTNNLGDRVRAYPLALSDAMKCDALHLSQFVAGGSCHTFGEAKNFELQSFNPIFQQGAFAMPFDMLVASGDIPVPQHIKVDVDGIEHKVIAGMRETLKHSEVKSVLIEINTKLPVHNEIIAHMQGYGFTFDAESARKFIRTEGDFQGVGNHIFYRKAA